MVRRKSKGKVRSNSERVALSKATNKQCSVYLVKLFNIVEKIKLEAEEPGLNFSKAFSDPNSLSMVEIILSAVKEGSEYEYQQEQMKSEKFASQYRSGWVDNRYVDKYFWLVKCHLERKNLWGIIVGGEKGKGGFTVNAIRSTVQRIASYLVSKGENLDVFDWATEYENLTIFRSPDDFVEYIIKDRLSDEQTDFEVSVEANCVTK